MAKQGMKRPEVPKLHPRNEQSPVPQIQGKAKSGSSGIAPGLPNLLFIGIESGDPPEICIGKGSLLCGIFFPGEIVDHRPNRI